MALAAPLSSFALTPPLFTSANSAIFPEGFQDSFTITASGNPLPLITESGNLPGGVKFVDNRDGTATLSGRPGNGLGLVGNYSLTFTASNGVNPPATQSFTLTITRPPAITSVNNATFVVGAANTFTVATRNSMPKSTVSVTGTLPGGVTFVANANGTATLSGTPVAGSEGAYLLTFKATNGTPPAATQLFILTVQDTPPVLAAPAFTSAASTTFKVGTEGIFTVRTTGTPTSSLSFTGTQPAWLSFVDNTDGTASLIGTPDPGAASYSFTIMASNGVAPDAMQTFTLFVENPPPLITSANNAIFVIGTSSTFIVRTSPPLPSATVGFTGTLPTGVNFVPNSDGTATLSGTAAAGSGGTYPLTITASNGTAPDAQQTFALIVQTAPPVLVAPTITSATNAVFTIGTSASFTFTTTGSPTPSLSLTGPQPTWLSFVDNTDGTATLSGTPDVGSAPSYAFTVTAQNGVAPVATQNFTLVVGQTAATTNLVNISTRSLVQTGENVAIGGFIITGTDLKKVVIRGMGPSLPNTIAGRLADPTLELHNAANVVIATNDNWKINDLTGLSQQAEIEGTTIPPSNDLESAIVTTLAPGNYSVVLAGKSATSGVGLVEVYDLATAANSVLANISTRGFVQTGQNVMIGGFILSGASGSGRVIVRAIGPSLPNTIASRLADPTLALHDGNGAIVASNDNWKINDQTGMSQQAEVEATTIPPSNDLESAIVATLPAGAYSAIVAGKNSGSGVALVEVYRLP